MPSIHDENYLEEVRRRERERQRARRENETPEERERRLQAARDYRARRRAAERPADAEVRLANRRSAQEHLSAHEHQVQIQAAQERRTAANVRQSAALQQAGFAYDASVDLSNHPLLSIGGLDVICQFCGARKYPGESDGICCSKGKIKFPLLPAPPEPIRSLFSNEYPESRNFIQNIRRYNSCFQMTSFGSTGGHHSDGFMPTFRVQGQIYHRIGALLPLPENEPKFLQIYFMGDANIQIDTRLNMFNNVKRSIIAVFQELFDQHNGLIRSFRSTLDRLPSDNHSIIIRADKRPEGTHERIFNAPTSDEVAIVIVDSELSRRDIVLQRRDSRLKRIDESHPFYDAFQYPIIFWKGQGSWHYNMKQVNPLTGAPTTKRASPMDFYAYQLMIRDEDQNFLLHCGPLLNQFVVDMYAKIEAQRLLWVKQNQKQLRAEEYIHLRDAIRSDANPSDLGQQVILPSSFIGGPRHMHEYAQDALAYVRRYGRPDLFITFTCNPKWPEITRELKQQQPNSDRHDITARVFRQKVIKLMDCLTKHKIFGESRCFMYSIEWQKRGLPHAHILLWLQDRIRPEQIDSIISAELPDPESDPILFEIIKSSMIHGPCGRANPNCPCMTEEGSCSKRYPRQFVDDTQSDADGYPMYRRRRPDQGGHSFTTQLPNLGTVTIDNRWVVPHNRTLSRIFSAHINVEYCHSVKSIKYICKYINKGSDMAVIGLQDQQANNEIEQYQLGRYISSNEAFWRILGFPIHDRHPAVVHLAVHLENGQRVYFTVDNAAHVAEAPPKTTLTAFFELCQVDEFARTLLYADVCTYYTWAKNKFSRRKQGKPVAGFDIKSSDTIGRLYTVHPSQAECFFLRMLLTKVRGPKSFTDLRTYEGTIYETYRQACQARNLLEDDRHWEGAMEEAAATKNPGQIRSLFAVILSCCNPSNPASLWAKFKQDLSEDLLADLRRQNPTLSIQFSDTIFNRALIILEDLTMSMACKTLQQLGLPAPERSHEECLRSEILRETSYDRAAMQRLITDGLPNLVEDQKVAYNAIMSSIQEEKGRIIFLDAPGGTGKTFLLNLILAQIRLQSKIILACASSGIAATLLAGGKTAHNMFKIPIDADRHEYPVCRIGRGTAKARLLRECKAIIWDECTMSHKKSLDALDRTLRDIREDDSIMGGVVLILAGDFRQTLPVIPRSTPADELNACLKQSPQWPHVQKYNLKTNMRVHLQGDIEAGAFAGKLLSIGDGTILLNQRGLIDLTPDLCQRVDSLDNLIDSVFPDLSRNISNQLWLCERAILGPTNEIIDQLNSTIQDKLVGRESRSYLSIDKTIEEEQAVHFPTEFLNSLCPTGTPPHELKLKVGSPVMVLRNLDPPRLCNGTRLCVKRLDSNTILATIMTGPAAGEDVIVPRIPFIHEDQIVQFKRIQFPLKLAFCFTINKSQGQSLRTVGVDLSTPVFSHGQLYVACSRVGSASNLHILAPQGHTKNVVYRQALD